MFLSYFLNRNHCYNGNKKVHYFLLRAVRIPIIPTRKRYVIVRILQFFSVITLFALEMCFRSAHFYNVEASSFFVNLASMNEKVVQIHMHKFRFSIFSEDQASLSKIFKVKVKSLNLSLSMEIFIIPSSGSLITVDPRGRI